MRAFAALCAGLLFGAGLSVSRMIDPAVVLAFLDFTRIVEGRWNPALAFVMAGAVLVTTIGYELIFRRGKPWIAATFAVPTRRTIDRNLIAGAAIFGLGWGLVGYCPGPAIAGLGLGLTKTWLFVAAMLVGMALHYLLIGSRNTDRASPPSQISGAGSS